MVLPVRSVMGWASPVMSSCLFYCKYTWHVIPALLFIPPTPLTGQESLLPFSEEEVEVRKAQVPGPTKCSLGGDSHPHMSGLKARTSF